jgi:hypothetical protein
MEHNGWDHALKVTGGGTGPDRPRRCGAAAEGRRPGGTDRRPGCGAAEGEDAGRPGPGDRAGPDGGRDHAGSHQHERHRGAGAPGPVLGAAPSGPTVGRGLDLAGTPAMLDRIARARAKARAHAWRLIEDTASGFPWLVIAGKALTGWVVIDLDATLVTAHRQGRSGSHLEERLRSIPLAAWAANTREYLAMLLRSGNAGSNTFTGRSNPVPRTLPEDRLSRRKHNGSGHSEVVHLRQGLWFHRSRRRHAGCVRSPLRYQGTATATSRKTSGSSSPPAAAPRDRRPRRSARSDRHRETGTGRLMAGRPVAAGPFG